MTLLLTLLAAAAATLAWYFTLPGDRLRLGTLALMYWGAAIMWGVDAAFEYGDLGTAYFAALVEGAGPDALLGLAVIVLGLIIWLAILLASDPNRSLCAALRREK